MMWCCLNVSMGGKEMRIGCLILRKCRGNVVFYVTENSWWKETEMWLDYMISSGNSRYLLSLAPPSLSSFLSIAVMNAWLWRKAETWMEALEWLCVAVAQTFICSHGNSHWLPFFSLPLNCMLSITHTHTLPSFAVFRSASPSIAFCLGDPPPFLLFNEPFHRPSQSECSSQPPLV